MMPDPAVTPLPSLLDTISAFETKQTAYGNSVGAQDAAQQRADAAVAALSDAKAVTKDNAIALNAAADAASTAILASKVVVPA
jgi:hypothetical protein